jgi:hypothetical protein
MKELPDVKDSMYAMVRSTHEAKWPRCCGADMMIGASGFVCIQPGCKRAILAFSKTTLVGPQVSAAMLREIFPERNLNS